MTDQNLNDFELRISDAGDEGYRVEVLRSPAGESNAILELPLADPGFQEELNTLEQARFTAGTTRSAGSAVRVIGGDAEPRQAAVDVGLRLGTLLFERMFASRIGETYRTALQRTRDENRQMRLRLRIETPELAAIPWEFLYDEREGDALCLLGDTHLVRYLELGRPQKPLAITPPLRVLGMVANPGGTEELDTEGERKLMHGAIGHLVDAGAAVVEWVEGDGWRDLEKALHGGPWHVFHFIGHGDFDEETQEGFVAFGDGQGGVQRFDATRLGRMLADHKSLKLAVLNCCKGGAAGENSLVSSVGAKLMQRGLPAVVSMQYEITDKAALEFARQFYGSLADEYLPIDVAVTRARKSLTYAIDNTLEWATPVLHMRAPSGELFEFDRTGAIFTAPDAEKPHDEQVPRSAGEPAAHPAPAAGVTRKRLLTLLHLVRRAWIEGVLDNALSQGELVNLQFRTIPDMVESPWGAIPVEEEDSIQNVFEELAGSFLILGVPGSGKTILMLSLARDLLDAAEQDPELPVPVIVNLSSWQAGGEFGKWFSGELSAKYSVPKKIVRDWLKDRRLMLLLDGLDEVNARRRADCVEAINRFMDESGPVSVVVCCRYKEYTELPVRLSLNGAVNLKNLTLEQVYEHLDSAGGQLDGLKKAMVQHSELRILARTPFHLNTMVRAYWGRDNVDLESMGIVTREERHTEVMQDFVARQFERTQGGGAGG